MTRAPTTAVFEAMLSRSARCYLDCNETRPLFWMPDSPAGSAVEAQVGGALAVSRSYGAHTLCKAQLMGFFVLKLGRGRQKQAALVGCTPIAHAHFITEGLYVQRTLCAIRSFVSVCTNAMLQ